MGKTIPMQPWISFQVDQSMDDIIQPAAGWLDGKDFRHLTLDVRVMENAAGTGAASLVLETAQSPTGPWTSLATYGAGYTHAVSSFEDDASPYLERFVRWSLDLSDVSLDAWKTSFRTWDDVVPDTLEEAIERDHFTAWAENRAFSEFVFADIHRHLREAVETIHEGAPVGEEGMFDADTYFGIDWEKFRSAATLVQGYERPRQHEHIRSLFPKTALTGYWIGYYSRDYSEEKMRWHPWHALFNGFNSVWWFTAAMMGPRFWPVAFAADLTPQDPFRWTAEEVRAIKRGIGKLILNADRQHDGIALLYSMPSIRAADAHPEISVQIGSEHYPGTIKSSELAWCLLIEDLGMQYEFVSHRDVAHGLLRAGDYDVLVLPTSVALSEGEAAAIRAFVREGGTVLADMWPGRMDEWANILPCGRLDDVFGVNLFGGIDLRSIDISMVHGEEKWHVPNRRASPAIRLADGQARATVEEIPVFIEHTFGRGRACLLNVSLNDYFSDWHRNEDHVDIRWDQTGRAVRGYIAEQMAHAGVEPPVRIRHQDGRPVVACEAVFFRRDDVRYLGLEYTPHIIYFANGDLDYQFRTFSLDPDVSPTPIVVTLPDSHHLYDVRAGKYIGQAAEFHTAIKPGQGLLFALLPYRVQKINLRTDSDRVVPIKTDGTKKAIHPRVSVELRTTSGQHPQVHCFRVDICDPSGEAIPAYGQNVLARRGRATFTVPFALNDPSGTWRVHVTDVATGINAELHLRVRG